MATHVSFADLLDYVSQTLPPKERATAEAHLAGPCAECQTNLRRTRDILDVLSKPDRTMAPPKPVVQHALALFKPLATWATLPQVIASLLFDSYQHAPATALRGASRTRQLLFSAEDLDIDMQITPERNSATLVGQVLSRTTAGQPTTPVVRLYQAGEVIDTSVSDPVGQFVFRAVPPGRYDIGVWIESLMVMIKGVELQHD